MAGRQERGGPTSSCRCPRSTGRDAAVARADQARKRGLEGVGVLDSSLYASLHPGYWMVFAGMYPSEPEAASRLREAKTVQKGARTRAREPVSLLPRKTIMGPSL